MPPWVDLGGEEHPKNIVSLCPGVTLWLDDPTAFSGNITTRQQREDVCVIILEIHPPNQGSKYVEVMHIVNVFGPVALPIVLMMVHVTSAYNNTIYCYDQLYIIMTLCKQRLHVTGKCLVLAFMCACHKKSKWADARGGVRVGLGLWK